MMPGVAGCRESPSQMNLRAGSELLTAMMLVALLGSDLIATAVPIRADVELGERLSIRRSLQEAVRVHAKLSADYRRGNSAREVTRRGMTGFGTT